MKIFSRSRPPILAVSALVLLTQSLLTLPGCGVGNTKLDDVEKARLIKENRKEARDVLERFKASGEKDIKLLEKYAELHHKNTEIAPSTCPKCWAEYGESLSMLGWKYWYDHQDLIDDMSRATPSEAKELKKEAAALKEKWVDYFTRSNNAYETHFRSVDVPMVHPYSYERVMRHWELLGNYERALYYLNKCVEGYPSLQGGLDQPRKEKFDKLRRIYKQEIQKQKEGEVTGGREKEPPARNPTGRRSAPVKREPVSEESGEDLP
jgi:tetratricopeptide (TPR) repeat protein